MFTFKWDLGLGRPWQGKEALNFEGEGCVYMYVIVLKVLKKWEQNWLESFLDWNNSTRLKSFWPKEQIWLKESSLQVPFTVIAHLQNPIIVKFWSLEWINQQFYWSGSATETDHRKLITQK